MTTSLWACSLGGRLTEHPKYTALVPQVMSQQGISLVRVFCFNDGYSLTNTPIQISPGVYNEVALKRIDLILAQAAQYGIYVIVVSTSFEPVGLQCDSCPGGLHPLSLPLSYQCCH